MNPGETLSPTTELDVTTTGQAKETPPPLAVVTEDSNHSVAGEEDPGAALDTLDSFDARRG